MRLKYYTTPMLASLPGVPDSLNSMSKRMGADQSSAPAAPPSPKDQRPLRLRVSPKAESILRAGHPWIFAQSIRDQNRTGDVGELAVVYDRKNAFLAVGLFDPTSPIRFRALHIGKPRQVTDAFWGEQLERAVEKRIGLFGTDTTGFRWINGESDGWPGLVLDRYDQVLVLKVYTAAWLPWLDQILATVTSRLQPKQIVLRLARNTQEVARDSFGRTDGTVIFGKPLQGPVLFLETGLQFEADVLRGQKTGFFLDQRENRRKVESLAHARTVLNAFSFSGGFSLYAARGGATSVTDLDISAHALAAGRRNFSLNSSERLVRECTREEIQADAFDWLSRNPSRKFDFVILDPPSLAKRESERTGAMAAYGRLASLGLAHLNPGGLLLACSCSAHVSDKEFFQAVSSTAASSERRFKELARAGHALDHPATIPEAAYLKAIYLQMD